MNLGASSGDHPANIAHNRGIVRASLPSSPCWLRQVHGTQVVDLDRDGIPDSHTADAAMSRMRGRVCTVLTADCLPILFCDAAGSRVAVAHAGWRGLAAGIVESTVKALETEPAQLMAWMGPAIGPRAFEVGAEVREAFIAVSPLADHAFAPHGAGKYLADLYTLARQRLEGMGVTRVFGGGFCTYRENERFFSYRREKKSGRMGAFIWIA